MKQNLSEQPVTLELQADKEVINQEEACTRIIEITITPPVKQVDAERKPLNLSLVLDRSGSMGGGKITFVKQAAAHVISLLDERDTASVVIYDDIVETLIHPGKATDAFKKRANSLFLGVNPRNSTFLSGGWLKGCELVATEATDESINRTLLLTDGLANVGLQNVDELATHARELFLRGVTTSCFGVGLGYDEHLLEAMANSGGGNFHFLETINAIPVVFEREFHELALTSFRDAVISLHVPGDVHIDVMSSWPTEERNGHKDILIGNLISGRSTKIYIKLQFNAVKSGTIISLPISVHGKGDKDDVYDVVGKISFTAVPGSDVESAPNNKPLLERFADVDMADHINEALKMERAGDRIGASTRIRYSLSLHEDSISHASREKFEFIANEALAGMDEHALKNFHRQGYETKRGRDIFRDYQLQMVNGHLIVRIEDLNVLIDTGNPISIGKVPKFYFSNMVHALSPSTLGVTTDYVEKMVGTPLDVILGMDILSQQYLTIDLHEGRIHFGTRPPLDGRNRLEMPRFMGIPSIVSFIEGSKTQMIVDTGAKLSYVEQSIAASYPAIGKEKDFYPGLGEFETSVYDVPIKLGKEEFHLRCGVLPPLLAKTLQISGSTGIIGTELYQKFVVCLAFPDNSIYLQKNRSY